LICELGITICSEQAIHFLKNMDDSKHLLLFLAQSREQTPEFLQLNGLGDPQEYETQANQFKDKNDIVQAVYYYSLARQLEQALQLSGDLFEG
jgi:hypothetical protein